MRGMGAPRHPLRVAIVLDKFLPSRGGERYFSFLAGELGREGTRGPRLRDEGRGGRRTALQRHVVRGRRFFADTPYACPLAARPGKDRRGPFRRSPRRCPVPRRYSAQPPWGRGMGISRAGVRFHRKSRLPRLQVIRRYLSPRHYLDTELQSRLYAEGGVRRVIAISRMVKADIVNYYKFPEDLIDVVFNTVDLDRFHPKNARANRRQTREKLGVGEDAMLLLFAGNNFRLKGLPALLKAMSLVVSRIPGLDLRLLVAGRGRPGRYRGLMARLCISDRVIFGGALPSMENVYGASDVYVHPTFYDSCSLTVLEALACAACLLLPRGLTGHRTLSSRKRGRHGIGRPGGCRRPACEAIAYYLPPERRAAACP